MEYVFRAETTEGYAVKTVCEILHNNFKTVCFEIDRTGIKIRTMDNHRIILVNVFMNGDDFQIYQFNRKEPLLIGVNLVHLQRMLKGIKKKEDLHLFIKADAPNQLGIEVCPKEGYPTQSDITIQPVQRIEIDLPEGYGKSIIINSGEFQKMIKGLDCISSQISIESSNGKITFSGNTGGVMKKSVSFGKPLSSVDSEEEDDDKYVGLFDTSQLKKVLKLHALSDTIQIYTKKDMCLYLRSRVSKIGEISIFIKSKDNIRNDDGN